MPCMHLLVSIQSHHTRGKMSKKKLMKNRQRPVPLVCPPYGSVLSYEKVTSQPNRLINLIWPECRTWFIGPWAEAVESGASWGGGGGVVRGVTINNQCCDSRVSSRESGSHKPARELLQLNEHCYIFICIGL